MKVDRQAVYEKYGKKCAYCGCDIGIEDMQVDHIVPVCNGGTNEYDNLNPTCPLCNHYKRGDNLESFRQWKLGCLIDRLNKIYIFRVAVKYGMIEIKNWDRKFYYEKEEIAMKVDLEELEDKLETAFNIVAKVSGIIVLPCVAICAILLCVCVVYMAFK